jgi:hypothetical protein
MSLVEAEATGPVEGDEPLITPPRPPHRRVSVSLLFTLTVLTSTVVAIYLVFPVRHAALRDEAIARHRATGVTWELTAPPSSELRAWWYGVVGNEAPLPRGATEIVGARRIEVMGRDAGVIRFRLGNDEVTYVAQRARTVAPKRSVWRDHGLRAIEWRQGPYVMIAVGPDASAEVWHAAIE